MKHLLEIRTTISPTPHFFRRIHYLAASLRDIGGELADHEIVVSVGGGDGDENYYRTQPWSLRYPIIWRPVAPEAYARRGYQATNDDRALHMSRARCLMIVDADIIFVQDFSELVRDVLERPAICGVMAHMSPFRRRPKAKPAFAGRLDADATPEAYWAAIFENYGLAAPPLDHEYSGWGLLYDDPHDRLGPAYFNGGMIIGPSDLMETMLRLFKPAQESVYEVVDTYFAPQIARTLAIRKAGVPARVLPMRYNFPNDPRFDAAFPDELRNLSILHYLRRDIVDRDPDFASQERVRELVGRNDLTGSNELLRRRVSDLSSSVLAEGTGEAAHE